MWSGRCAVFCCRRGGAARARGVDVGAAAVSELADRHVQVAQRNEAVLAEISQVNLELLRRRALR